MNSVSDTWQLAADKWDEVVNQVSDDDWAKSTPCDGWTVRELVDHAMHWQGRGGGVFGADADKDADWATLKPALATALADPANLEGNAEALGGTPKQAVAGLITADLLVHSWDLARSIGADATLPEAAAESTLMGLQRLPEEMLRSDRMFGPAVEVADDASAQDRLIAFVGRTP
ncbi:MAG: TIGR03086 family metal-binding protein [Acidimicrobiales bacterium]